MKRIPLLAIAAALFFAPFTTVKAFDDWQIVKLDNRDYVSLDNIARFYALQPHAGLVGNRTVLGDEHTRLELCSNPRQIYVNGVEQWLSFPIVNQNGQMLVSRFDLAKTIEPCLRPTLISNLRPFHTVVLDAGHGGQDSGGRSALGPEKEYTLDVIGDLKKSLERKGLKVILTRETDQYVSLENRATRANDVADSVLVSVHFNSSDASATGFEVFAMTPRGAASTGDAALTTEQFNQMPGNDFDDASLAMATCVHHSLLGHLPQTDRGVKRARFAVLRLTHSPGILVEGGFLSNPTDSQNISDPAWQQRLADAIAVGVESFQNVSSNKTPPKLLADYRSEQLPMLGVIVNPAAVTAAAPSNLLGMMPVSNPAPYAVAAPQPNAVRAR